MRIVRALGLFAMGMAVAACQPSRVVDPPSQPTTPTAPTPATAPTSPTAPSTPVPVDTAAAQVGDACPLHADLHTAWRDATTCERNTDCAIVEASLCNVKPLGCYWAAINPSRPQAKLQEAIDAYVAAPSCQKYRCDCAGPPANAVCTDGACRGDLR